MLQIVPATGSPHPNRLYFMYERTGGRSESSLRLYETGWLAGWLAGSTRVELA